MKNRKLICVILAAGKGTRMQSDLPKVLYTVAGMPMLTHVIRAAESLVPDQIRVVTGPGQDNVAAIVPRTHTLVQNVAQMGTGYAVRAALEGVNLAATDVLILFGDVPLVPHGNLRDLYARHTAPDAPAVTILAMTPDSPRGYGRLVTDAAGRVLRVVEELDATEEERQITLCSSGMMILRGEGLMDHLSRIENKNAKGEYYLLDILPFVRAASGFAAYAQGSAPDLKGVNDPTQLQEAQDRYTTLHRSASAQPRRA